MMSTKIHAQLGSALQYSSMNTSFLAENSRIFCGILRNSEDALNLESYCYKGLFTSFDLSGHMTRRLNIFSPEIAFTAIMLAIMLSIATAYSLPVLIPSGERAAFVGIHYLYPLIGVAIWGIIALIGQRKNLARTFFIAFPCYALIQWIHFNIKLWVPHINPYMLDDIYWKTDQFFRPLIDLMYDISHSMAWLVPLDSNMYMIGFIAIFYISFCFHAIMTPDKFRTVFVAALLFQGLGALAYLPFPALGPFIYEQGLNPKMTAAQLSMLAFHKDIVAHDASWLIANGPANITAGLGAMPSLHAGGSFLFFILAWKYARVLIPLYSILLAFILVSAVTTRWHYLIDLPVGMMIAWVSVWLAEKFTARGAEKPVVQQQADEPALVLT